jgi:nondiscriminating aspartyl-tRNA synthetase
MASMIRTHYISELLAHLGNEVTVAGWIDNLKDLPNLRFVVIRDATGLAQVTIRKKDARPDVLESTEGLNLQDVVSVRGIVSEKQVAKVGPEILPSEVRILGNAESPLPIDMGGSAQTQLDTRLDWRPLDLRSPRNLAIFRIESKLMEGLEEYLRSSGFVRVSTPSILGGTSEGGSEVFRLDYFGRQAFLRQDPQLHRQLAVAGGIDRLYDLGPNWRAELSHTPRHLCEHRACAAELGFIEDETDTERFEEKMIAHALRKVAADCQGELSLLGVTVQPPTVPFPELRFPAIYDILEAHGKRPLPDTDLNREAEQILSEHVKRETGSDFFFINRFPFAAKPFYVMRVDDDPQWARSVDLVYRGLEVSSGGQREHRYSKLMEQVRSKGIDERGIEWFTKNFRYGVPPHGGFALGIERTVAQMLGIENLKEVCLFPRTPERLEP